MSSQITIHPLLFEKRAALLRALGVECSIEPDGKLEPNDVHLRMEPGDLAARLIAVLRSLGDRVLLTWREPIELADWLEGRVARRRNLGGWTFAAAQDLAAELSLEESGALRGWSIPTARRQRMLAENQCGALDFADLRAALELRGQRGESGTVIFERLEPERLPGPLAHQCDGKHEPPACARAMCYLREPADELGGDVDPDEFDDDELDEIDDDEPLELALEDPLF